MLSFQFNITVNVLFDCNINLHFDNKFLKYKVCVKAQLLLPV